MKERPIIFSGPMIRAILDGSKTVTRRPTKPQPTPEVANPLWRRGCPYGVPGDELWVREGFCYLQDENLGTDEEKYLYRADGKEVFKDDGDGGEEINKDGTEASPWKPSIHMPRWASRIQLVVKSVRAERLQEITRKDAKAEGCDLSLITLWPGDKKGAEEHNRRAINIIHQFGWEKGDAHYADERTAFTGIWHTMYAKKPDLDWDANPWVWRVEFERKGEHYKEGTRQ